MDEIFSKNKLQIAIPILFGAIYLSSFKNGKQTCDRYFVNYFLYLLISSAAVFIPIPGTPGILSEESPAKD